MGNATASQVFKISASALPVKSKLLRGLADTSRLSVLESLRNGPLCVSEVIEQTGLSQPNVSAHLACLWDCGLVEREQQGRFVYYRIADPRVEALLAAADDLLVTVGESVYVCTRYTGDGGPDGNSCETCND